MTRNEVITKLKQEGYGATVGRLRQALMNGYMEPLPDKRARGAYDFRPQHLTQLRWYFVHVRPGPKPCRSEDLPVLGATGRGQQEAATE